MINPQTESLPFKPLPKIKAPIVIAHTPLQLGERVQALCKHGVWREFEVSSLDGDMCRLTTLDKRFRKIAKIKDVVQLRDMQRRK